MSLGDDNLGAHNVTIPSRQQKNRVEPGVSEVILEDLQGCVSPSCIEELASRIAVVYQRKPNREAWCTSTNYMTRKGVTKGIILVKVPKGASSTSAGVALRLENRFGCKNVKWAHQMATNYKHHDPDSLFFTTIRDPAKRSISTIFFHIISRSNVKHPSDGLLLQLLQERDHSHFGSVSTGQGGFQLRYMSLDNIEEFSAWSKETPDSVKNPETVVRNVQNIMSEYTILLVTERMDESLVCLALLLGIDVSDVLVTASKVSGSRYHFTRVPGNKTVCFPTVKSFTPPKVKAFFESDRWRAMNYGDYLLHAAASKSLDLTIASLQPEFDVAMERYKKLSGLAQNACSDEVVFPCSNEGVPQPQLSQESCYLPYFDFGCGYKCVDRTIQARDSKN